MTSEQETPNQTGQPDEPQARPPRPPFFDRREGRILLYSSMGLFSLVVLVFGFFYLKFGPRINQRLAAGPFSGSVNIFSAPRSVAVGDALTIEEVVARLRRAGY